MCEATTIAAAAVAAVSAAGTGASYSAQHQKAKAQANHQRKVAEGTNTAANRAYLQQVSQEQGASKQKLSAAQREARQAQSAARVSAGEAGVSGLSIDALLDDFNRQRRTQASAIQKNYQWASQGHQATAQGRIAQSRPGPTAFPSALAAGLQIGGSAMQGYNFYQQNQPPRGE